LGETETPSSSRADMTETLQTMEVKDPSSTLPVAFRRAVSEDIGDELRRLCGSSACRPGAGVSESAGVSKMTCLGKDESIRQPLVIALAMIMRDEIPNGGPQRFLSEQDHPLQTGFFDAPHESFGVSV